MGIQVSVVLAGAKGPIFLWDKKERCGLGGFGWENMSGLEMFLHKGLAGLFFFGVQRVNLGDFGYKRRFKVYGVTIGAVGRKDIICFLREHVVEVFAPFR